MENIDFEAGGLNHFSHTPCKLNYKDTGKDGYPIIRDKSLMIIILTLVNDHEGFILKAGSRARSVF